MLPRHDSQRCTGEAQPWKHAIKAKLRPLDAAQQCQQLELLAVRHGGLIEFDVEIRGRQGLKVL